MHTPSVSPEAVTRAILHKIEGQEIPNVSDEHREAAVEAAVRGLQLSSLYSVEALVTFIGQHAVSANR